MMDKVVHKNKGISHIQYADDTVLMIDGSEQSITDLKLVLYCFEWLFGLKIIFFIRARYMCLVPHKGKKNRWLTI
jgi:hypothetical protein